ncbi:hypothetical protein BRC82_02170 [Halobacteriales archaeon QS_1_67_19]|nr:MAG: hypothetical protein BRC82_02170 [Halobacteriales archaeon QS_1_67_19]
MTALKALVADRASEVSWAFVALLALAIGENLLEGDLIWTALLVAALVILVLPPVAFRDRERMLPPSVTALAVLPGVTRALGSGWVTDYATYLAVAALALAVVVELSLFTAVEMAPWFAGVTVVLATMAAIGVWAILQFASDAYLGTEFIASADALMWEFVRATIAGVAAAAVFEFYFEYRDLDGAGPTDLPGGERA